MAAAAEAVATPAAVATGLIALLETYAPHARLAQSIPNETTLHCTLRS